MRDVLAEISAGAATLHDVEEFYNSVMESSDAERVAELLGLSRQEWTAFGHGVWFDELARWRRDGWPTVCGRCGGIVDVERFGWLAVNHGDGHRLEHVVCP